MAWARVRLWLSGQPYVLLVLTTLMWSGNAVASRLAVNQISPMALTFLRWLAAAGVLAVLARRQVSASWPALAPRWPSILWMGTLGFTGFNALFYAAGYHTTAINIAIFQGSIPVLVLFGALVFYRIPFGPIQGLGFALTLLGVALVATRGELATLRTLSFNIGDVWMLVACLLYAAYTLGLRNRPAVPGLAFFTVMAGVAAVTSLPLFVAEILRGEGRWPTLEGLGILLYVSFFPSLLAQLFYMRGVELIGPGRAGLFVNLVPVFGPLLSVLVLGEPFMMHHALGLALVLGGIFTAERAARPAKPRGGS